MIGPHQPPGEHMARLVGQLDGVAIGEAAVGLEHPSGQQGAASFHYRQPGAGVDRDPTRRLYRKGDPQFPGAESTLVGREGGAHPRATVDRVRQHTIAVRRRDHRPHTGPRRQCAPR